MDQSWVMVTGAAGTLGRAVAQSFLQSGARLVLVDIDAAALASAFGENMADRVAVAADLTDAAGAETALAPVLERCGTVGILCNIAGGFSMGPAVHETADAAWRHLMDLNVATMINASRLVVPTMLRAGGGKIVNVSAASAVRGIGAMGAYCAAKGAVARLTEAMAQELRDGGINVNAVAPSIIDTPVNRAAMPDVSPSRWVSPEDLAQVVRFLASDAARAVHGAVVPVVGLS